MMMMMTQQQQQQQQSNSCGDYSSNSNNIHRTVTSMISMRMKKLTKPPTTTKQEEGNNDDDDNSDDSSNNKSKETHTATAMTAAALEQNRINYKIEYHCYDTFVAFFPIQNSVQRSLSTITFTKAAFLLDETTVFSISIFGLVCCSSLE